MPFTPTGDPGVGVRDMPCGQSMYRTLDAHGCSSVARQKGLYRSIEDEWLQPQEHLRQALLLSGGPSSVVVPEVIVRAINAYPPAV